MTYTLKLSLITIIALTTAGCSSVQPKGAERWAGYTEVGKAAFYSDRHQGKKTASGELYDAKRKTAAHRKLPFGSRVRVTNPSNGESVVVTINDRGPSSKDRLIDLSRSAFSSIGDTSAGTIRVRVEMTD